MVLWHHRISNDGSSANSTVLCGYAWHSLRLITHSHASLLSRAMPQMASFEDGGNLLCRLH